MQDQVRTRWKTPARTATGALVLGLAWFIGGAVAQQSGEAQEQGPAQPADLFGTLPEPPTEPAAPAPILDPANSDYTRLQPAQEAFSTLPADKSGKPDWMRALREGVIQP